MYNIVSFAIVQLNNSISDYVADDPECKQQKYEM